MARQYKSPLESLESQFRSHKTINRSRFALEPLTYREKHRDVDMCIRRHRVACHAGQYDAGCPMCLKLKVEKRDKELTHVGSNS